MATAHDVAKYILEKRGEMSAMKLQKLLYYCQAWSLVWDEKPLFGERIEAWVNGPVVRDLYAIHRLEFLVSTWPRGDVSHLDTDQRATIDAVLTFYGDKTAQWLSDLTHREDPWRNARKGLGQDERSENEITPVAMAEYYSAVASRP